VSAPVSSASWLRKASAFAVLVGASGLFVVMVLWPVVAPFV
jgi:hypothetical protein